MFLIHPPRTAIKQRSSVITVSDMLDDLDAEHSKAEAALAKRMKDPGQYLDGKDHWFSAAQAEAAGLVDKIIQ